MSEVLASYAGSDCANALVAMMDRTITSYQERLEMCCVDELVKLQTAIKQCRAIRGVALGTEHSSPQI